MEIVKYNEIYKILKLEFNQNGGNRKGNNKMNNVYIIHRFIELDSLIKILKSGKIKKDPKNNKGFNPMSQRVVFLNGYSPKIKNITSDSQMLILSDKILEDFDVYFNHGWKGGIGPSSIKINNNKQLLKELKNPKINKKLLKLTKGMEYMRHEIMIDNDVDINKYLVGIIVEKDKENIIKPLLPDKTKIYKSLNNLN
jgi:hypothetical protein